MKRPFENITSSKWFTILIISMSYLVMFFLTGFRTSTPHPLSFVISLVLIVLFMGSFSSKFGNIKKLAGIDEPISGYNAMIAVFGLGLGGLIYSFINNPAHKIYAGLDIYYNLFRPFFLPTMSVEYSLSIILLVISSMVQVFMVLLIFKNLTNYFFVEHKDSLGVSATLSLLLTNLFWGVMHIITLPVLNFYSLFFFLIFSTLFWMAYIIPDITGLLSPGEGLEWSGILSIGIITTFTSWSVYVIHGAFLPFWQFVAFSVSMVLLALGGMYILRYNHEMSKKVTVVEDWTET